MHRWTTWAGLCAIAAATGCDYVLGLERDGDRDAAGFDAAPIPGVIARYRFESATTIDDDTGVHDGQAVGPLKLVTGAMDLAIEMSGQSHVVVRDAPAWDGARAIEVWVRLAALPDPDVVWGIGSRDNVGVADGHLAIGIVRDRFFARLQLASDALDGSSGAYL